MDEALGSGRYDDYRSRSRSPSRRGFNDNYNDNRRGDVDPYFENGNDYHESRRGGRGRGGFRRGGGFRGGRGRGGFRGGRGRGGFRGGRGSYGGGSRREFQYDSTPIDRNYENSIFVGNLSFDCTAEDLRDHFNGIGEIVSADIIFSHGRHKGMGTVEFVDHQMVEDAINQLDGTMFMDRDIFVKQDRAPPGQERRRERRLEFSNRDQEPEFATPPGAKLDGYEVFIVNLPYATTWQDLKDLFRQAGDVIRADVELDFRGYSRGFGNVFFPTKEEMYKAIDMFNGYDLDGRVLEVREGRYNHLVDEERRGREGFPVEEERQPRTESRFNNGSRFDNESRFDNGDRMEEEPVEDVVIEQDSVPETPISTFTEGIVGGGDKNNMVYCSNLPLATSSTDLYELFESFGRVEKAELKFDGTGAPTGIAVIEYIDADTAELCISKLNNYNYGGNDLAVSYAQHNTEL